MQYTISNDPKLIDIGAVHGYLSQESYWAKGIPYETVKKSIEGSMCFGVYCEEAQVGFARVVTDLATFAYLADVYILAEHRGKGLSKKLLQAIHGHPELQGLRRWMLATRDAHGLYATFGWKAVEGEQAGRLMQINRPDIYVY